MTAEDTTDPITAQIWANLAVDDVERTRAFYRELGFRPNGPHESPELASVLVGDHDFVIHLWQRERYEDTSEGRAPDLSQGSEVMFTLAATSREAVDRWTDAVAEAGGTVLYDPRVDSKPLYDDNGFYSCAFADPDGHRFNVFFNEGAAS